MFYIWIAIAVAVGVSIGNIPSKDKKEFLVKLWGRCLRILTRLVLLSFVCLCIYLVWHLIKETNWKSAGNIILGLILYFSPLIIFSIIIGGGLWLDKKRQERKEKRKKD